MLKPGLLIVAVAWLGCSPGPTEMDASNSGPLDAGVVPDASPGRDAEESDGSDASPGRDAEEPDGGDAEPAADAGDAASTPALFPISINVRGEKADRDVGRMAISGDGRVVAYYSQALNLVPFKPKVVEYSRYRIELGERGPTAVSGSALHDSRIALSFDGTSMSWEQGRYIDVNPSQPDGAISHPTGGGSGNGEAFHPSMSADAMVIGYESTSTNLTPGDTNQATDVFVRDRTTRTTELISVPTSGFVADGPSWRPRVSGDGRFVVFVSEASNLVAGDTNGVADVFVRDRMNSTTTRVNVSATGAEADAPADVDSAISADGAFIAFSSAATTLHSSTPAGTNIYVTAWQTTGIEAPFSGTNPELSADGQFVAYASVKAHVRDRLSGADWESTFDLSSPELAFSANGGRILYRALEAGVQQGYAERVAIAPDPPPLFSPPVLTGIESWVWQPMQLSPVSERAGGPIAWTGSDMIAFGLMYPSMDRFGYHYSPSTNMWTLPTQTSGAPSARTSHTTVWTGSALVVYGGYDRHDEGAWKYDPILYSWTSENFAGEDTGRYGHSAVWTGTEMIIWGGHYQSTPKGPDGCRIDGHAYNPTTETWTPISTTNAPSEREQHPAFWTGNKMLILPGSNWCGVTTDGASYDRANDSWSPMSTVGAPALRNATSTGTELIVWDGAAGGRYDPVLDQWSPMSTVNAPGEGKMIWTGTHAFLFGEDFWAGVAAYDPAMDLWTPLPPARLQWSDSPGLQVLWAGDRVVVWGQSGRGTTRAELGAIFGPLP